MNNTETVEENPVARSLRPVVFIFIAANILVTLLLLSVATLS